MSCHSTMLIVILADYYMLVLAAITDKLWLNSSKYLEDIASLERVNVSR